MRTTDCSGIPPGRLLGTMRQRRWLKWVLYLAGWSLIGFFFAIQEWFTYPAEKPPLTWARQLSSEMGFWYAWAALFPVIWWLARRFPLESARLGRRLLFHLPASAFFAMLQPFLQPFRATHNEGGRWATEVHQSTKPGIQIARSICR